jgi:hypothetical protein
MSSFMQAIISILIYVVSCSLLTPDIKNLKMKRRDIQYSRAEPADTWVEIAPPAMR